MAIATKDKRTDEEEDDERDESAESPEPSRADEALARTDEGDGDGEKADALEKREGEPEGEEEEEDPQAAGQLGTERYVIAGFFAAAILGAYVFAKTLVALWMSASNRDWFSQAVPFLAAVPEDDKSTYAFLVSGLVATIVAFRTYRRPDVRAWSDEVAAELAKVVWPTRKEVQSATMVVIVASTTATLYLALLDRLWAFVTNIVYGDGS